MGTKKKRRKVRCKKCKKVIFLNDGKHLIKKKSIWCPHCEYENKVVVKKNGKIKIL